MTAYTLLADHALSTLISTMEQTRKAKADAIRERRKKAREDRFLYPGDEGYEDAEFSQFIANGKPL